MSDIKASLPQSENPEVSSIDTNVVNNETIPSTDAPDIVINKLSTKKKIIIAIIATIIILSSIGAYFFIKHHKEQVQNTENEQKLKDANQELFHDMDEMIVNLNSDSKNPSFMKLTITLDVEGKDNLDAVVKLIPRIKDVFQVYLRELRPSDMQGSIGLYKLREELLLRINKIVSPAIVKDILFKEVLIQ